MFKISIIIKINIGYWFFWTLFLHLVVKLIKACTKKKHELKAYITQLGDTSLHCKSELYFTLYSYRDCYKALDAVHFIVAVPRKKPKGDIDMRLKNLQLQKDLTICLNRSFNLSMSLQSEKVLLHQEMKKTQ